MLGPLEIVVDGEPVSVGGPRMRRLFGSLALGNGSVRSTDSLIEAVWAEDEPPDGARRTVMSYVSRLRSALGEDVVEQIENGYRLDRSLVETDVHAFEQLVASGQRMFHAGNLPHALALFDEALDLWRGEPLAEFAGEPWAEPERTRLSLLRLSALEDAFAAR
ncbi:MAG: AfsR/SARP family transcriptional regulator, partial [Ilumatobacter sp.]|nr:AfsR/SARP family transcriptional regulator [Ilumatobacter sp.]